MELLAFTHAAITYESSDSISADIEGALCSSQVSWLGLMVAIATLVASSVSPALALGLGDAGLSVEQLQTALQGRSYYEGGINGFYGARTEAAVLAFQRENGLVATGVADTETLSLLGVDSGSAPQTVSPFRPAQPFFSRPVVTNLGGATRPVVSSQPGLNQAFYGTSATMINNRAFASGVVQTSEGFGINVRSSPGGQIIGGEFDGVVIGYNPATAVTSGGYTWVQTTTGGWVASNYLRSSNNATYF